MNPESRYYECPACGVGWCRGECADDELPEADIEAGPFNLGNVDEDFHSAVFPDPRPFQAETIAALKEGFRSKHRCQMVMAPTGAGKTALSMMVMGKALQNGKRVIFAVDRLSIMEQTSQVADSYRLPHNIVQAGHHRRGSSRFQIASILTIAKKGWPQSDLLVVDECFVGSTMVSTPRGETRIDNVRCGDNVYNGLGIGTVEAISMRPSTTTLRLEFHDGSTTECTETHPAFTSEGWRQAGLLAVGSVLVGIEGLQAMWEHVQPIPQDGFEKGACRTVPKFVGEAAMLLSVLCEEAEEPDEQPPVTASNGGNVETDQASAHQARRERAIAAFASLGSSPRTRGRMGGRGHRKDRIAAGLSEFLQSRPCEPREDGVHRGGRGKSRNVRKASPRREEDGILGFYRVVRISRVERESAVPVYNLRVSGHPSYFADDRLVHNCHIRGPWVKHVMASGGHVIGLSATPFTKGLGKIFTRLINSTTTAKLVADGVLVPPKIMQCVPIDMTGAKRTSAKGEWTVEEQESRGMMIVGDIVSDWSKYHNPETPKTIVFGSTIAHCGKIAREFNECGISAAVFSAETPDHERAVLLREYKKQDSSLNVLVSVSAISRGFDAPDTGTISMARPLSKSLSEYMQALGRGLRGAPGKTFCQVLDHAGNSGRFKDDFAEIYWNGLDSLDSGDKLDEKIRKEPKEKGAKCRKCGYSPCGRKCVSCGYEYIPPSLENHAAGEMRELKVGKALQTIDAAAGWNQIASHCRSMGNPATIEWRAKYAFKHIFKTTPPSFSKASVVPVTGDIRKQYSAAMAHYQLSKGR